VIITEDRLHKRKVQYLLRRKNCCTRWWSSKGLSEKICNSFESSYSVMSLSKPSADLDTIISTSYFKTDNILKSDMIIVCGGTWDISSNETNKGLRCFRQFSMKASNNLFHNVDFSTRFNKTSCSAIDNSWVILFKVLLIINDLSDHDA
jgi:hypothetical protein